MTGAVDDDDDDGCVSKSRGESQAKTVTMSIIDCMAKLEMRQWKILVEKEK